MSGTQASRNVFLDGLLALMVCVLCTCFNAAYITYFYVIAVILFISLKVKQGQRQISLFSTDEKWIFLSVLLCYAGMLISAVCLMDTSSVLISVKLFSFASPLFIFWYFGLYHDIRNGIKYGVYAGSAINILGCALQYAGVHLSRPILDINRAQGFFGGPNTTGMVISYIIPLLCWYAFIAKKWQERLLSILLIAGSMICLLATGSRDAMGGLIVGILISLLLWGICDFQRIKSAFLKHKKRILLLSVISVLLIGITFFAALHQNLKRSGGERPQMMQASIAIWQDHKILGVGIARWAEYYQKQEYHPQGVREKNIHPHNIPILFLSTTGIIGGVCYLLSTIGIFFNLLKNLRYKEGLIDTYFTLPAMAVFLAFTAEGLFDSTLWWKEPTALFFFVVGTYLNSLRYYKS